MALVGLALSIGWLIADGLDGMVARATKTASPLGRMLDGLCDHGVFALIYISLALTIDTPEAWILAVAAGGAHAVQSNMYEGERSRFHRRIRGVALDAPPVPTGNALVRFYDGVAGSIDRIAMPFERTLGQASDPVALGQSYAARAVAPLRFMALPNRECQSMGDLRRLLCGQPAHLLVVRDRPSDARRHRRARLAPSCRTGFRP
ncbi:CDP-alcohol phosphatidyltransferase family protein [Sphingomonas aerolata]|uniref:CDP-alcohol phosphatidyltransferase family protein n=1 Tax=Sphingomonas aerolata TaxID=185951 RepID=UPI002FE42A40